MSLLATASLWQNDSAPKKRVSTMGGIGAINSKGARKTVKLRPYGSGDYDSYATDDNSDVLGDSEETSIEATKIKQEETVLKVNTALNKITGFSTNEGNRLADFNPIEKPEIISKKVAQNEGPPALSGILKGSNNRGGPYKPVDTGANYSNYANVYPSTIPPPASSPYYAKMGIKSGAVGSDKLMEKLNYMVHLLEEQQAERTNNVTEEFILYTLLGVFIIYVVDGFSRSGKYVR
jgi:hypothetical protein